MRDLEICSISRSRRRLLFLFLLFFLFFSFNRRSRDTHTQPVLPPSSPDLPDKQVQLSPRPPSNPAHQILVIGRREQSRPGDEKKRNTSSHTNTHRAIKRPGFFHLWRTSCRFYGRKWKEIPSLFFREGHVFAHTCSHVTRVLFFEIRCPVTRGSLATTLW